MLLKFFELEGGFPRGEGELPSPDLLDLGGRSPPSG